ncbi:uncharacterized protein MYCFIDRAFT_183938 [Pseudocercospora fijiensis CIRAD86]|uniref:Uncharacterized protein n=1 Tax=Pseudocercospora fijiensis (strain CIRAD86) TaxID=383855 RepID=M2YLI7_PSEFD|nr:uncharacterized protein MYCFIDRAFT_183938 [Pseudocercospora fijiensis CIRAD86]EME78605.1 hypothetical protein MYCFIDRAFT_183938 [Pseudocercospora fijiensis CIRAD86]
MPCTPETADTKYVSHRSRAKTVLISAHDNTFVIFASDLETKLANKIGWTAPGDRSTMARLLCRAWTRFWRNCL